MRLIFRELFIFFPFRKEGKEGRIYRWNKYHYLQSGRWNGQRKICNNEKPLSYYGSRRLF